MPSKKNSDPKLKKQARKTTKPKKTKRKITKKIATPQKTKKQSHTKAYIALMLLLLSIVSILISSYFYSQGNITIKQYEAYTSIAISLMFPLIVFSYLLYKKGSLKAVFGQVGLGRDKLTYKNIKIGIYLFFAILLLEISLSIFQYITGIKLPTNVQKIYSGMPIWFFMLTFTLIPFDEETMFRGFLVPRIGIIVSALIFAVLHASYLSISELIAAFIYGLLAGYTFKKTGSLYTTIIAHALINALAIIGLVYGA